MEKYKVSIIVAIYNIENYVKKCIDSIIDQDYSNLEIILVNDNSTDASGDICDYYVKIDSRIKVIHHKQNTRHSIVRNDGLDAATGDFIVFVDGDDWLAKDFVSYMLKVITITNSDMAINLVNFTTRDLVQEDSNKIETWTAEKATAELLFPHLTIGCWNKIYKRDFIEKNNLRFRLNLYTAEGDKFINEAAQKANKVGVGSRKVYYYRLNNSNSATTKYDIKQSQGAIDVFKQIQEELIIKTPYVISAFNHHVWLNHVWNLRQIQALNLKKEYYKEYKESISYIKSNFWQVMKCEKSIKIKVKFFITGLFPVLTAKIMNYRFDSKLKKDIKNSKSNEKGED